VTKRIEWLDFGKGITMLLVVIGHVLLGLSQTKLYSGFQLQTMKYIVVVLYATHMPIFFALSGYIYALKKNRFSSKRLVTFNLRKLLALGIPYVLFSVIYWLLKRIGSGSSRIKFTLSDLVNIYKSPLEYLWFLYTLFFVFLLISVLDTILKNTIRVSVVLLMRYLMVSAFPIFPFFIQRTVIWALFFYCGKLLHLYSKLLASKTLLMIATVVVVIFMSFRIYQPATTDMGIDYSNLGLYQTLVSLAIVLIAFKLFSSMSTSTSVFDYFDKIGPITLTIYLIHVPFESVFRIVLLHLGLSTLWLQIILGVVISWYFSLACQYVINKITWLDFLFYPARYITETDLEKFVFGSK